MGDYGKLIGHRVISIEEGKRCGNVIDFLVDYDKFKVFGVIVKGGWNQDAEIIPFGNIESIGSDAIMILNSKAIKSVKNLAQAQKAIKEHINISKLEVITQQGHVVGKIATFEFDASNGKIQQFEIAGSVFKSIFEGRNIIPVSQIISIGKDAMIIRDKKGPAKKPAPAKAPAKPAPKKKAAPKKASTKKKTAPKKKAAPKKKTGGKGVSKKK